MYLVNCRFGLHGPIEVLSREAVQMFVQGVDECQSLRRHPWGEDKYLDHCLQRLGVRRVLEFQLLSETACGQEPVNCASSNVAFHPFKGIQSYFDCWGQAMYHGNWPGDALSTHE
uniref:Hexosyltransferase n=1 Tax=Zooxanthella nutricula TaxID=1333877 RepID=A0A7S2HIV7_9DINO